MTAFLVRSRNPGFRVVKKLRTMGVNGGSHCHIEFKTLDFNREFTFPEGQFDLLSCCFALYYADDIPFTVREMHRVIKAGGRLFTSGPMPTNKSVFYDIIREATARPTSRAPLRCCIRAWYGTGP